MLTQRKRVRVPDLLAKKQAGEKITMLTAYDYTMARLMDEAGIDSLLVGDSLGNVVLGHTTTLPVTLDEMIHHAKAVRRGTKNALLVVDMPFMTFQVSEEDAVRNAGRLMKETGVDAVKVEGGMPVVPLVKKLTSIGIPVMGHMGMTPQSVHQFGGFKVQGKEEDGLPRLIEEAQALEEAGAFAIVLEMMPERVASEMSAALTIPTIGIGAGRGCDGQVLVSYDMLGMFSDFQPRFVKRYVEVGKHITEAVQMFVEEVKQGEFPAEEHTYDD